MNLAWGGQRSNVGGRLMKGGVLITLIMVVSVIVIALDGF